MQSWILHNAICWYCSSEIIVTQGKERDYRYYCSNPDCVKHIDKEDLFDSEECSFAWKVNKKEEWIHDNPEAKASLNRGFDDLNNNRLVSRNIPKVGLDEEE